MTDPIFALLIFTFGCLAIFLVFRPGTGFYWVLKNALRKNQKVLTEDILKQLYHLEYDSQKATLNDLAGALKIEHSQLVKLITIMEANKLIISQQGNLKLSDMGRDYALKIIRVHRLWEKYLAEQTGVDKTDWHKLAELKEHELDSFEADKLAERLGNPRYDPHGDPIPTKKGEIPTHKGQLLSDFPIGLPGRIIHIEDEPEVIYKQILSKDLYIGAHVKVVESDEHGIRFNALGEEHFLPPVVAANISVVRLDHEEKPQENISRLSSLKIGEEAKVIGISAEYRGASRRRLLDLGFVPGTKVISDFLSPMKDPRAYKIRNTTIALRNEQADLILIEKINSNGKSN